MRQPCEEIATLSDNGLKIVNQMASYIDVCYENTAYQFGIKHGSRNYKIVVEAIDLLTGLPVSISAVELLSICLQHEIDHLDGILYHDHIDKKSPMHVNPNWLVIE